jgi:hypothetical protein
LAQRIFPAFESPLPTIGKGQYSSLRHANGVSIIPESRRMSRRGGKGRPWTDSKNSGNASMKRWRD